MLSLVCIAMLSVDLPLSLSLPRTPSTVKAIGGVCLSFLLNNGEMRWRAPIRRLCSTPRVDHFSQVSDHQRDLSGYTLKCSATLQSVNIPLQKTVAFENDGGASVHAFVLTAVCNVGIPE